MPLRDQLITDVIANTGLRISDVLALRPDQIAPQIEIHEIKTGKLRTVHLPPKLRAKLRRYAAVHARDGVIFDIAPSTYYRSITRAAKHYGYDHLSAHSIRKMYAYDYCCKYGLAATQRELQHDEIMTTVLYVYDIDKLQEDINAHDDG